MCLVTCKNKRYNVYHDQRVTAHTVLWSRGMQRIGAMSAHVGGG